MHRYEPPRGIEFITKKPIYGAPDMSKATTAHVERQNLTMRHRIGRTRRLCLAFSKKLANHKAAVALSYAWYNLGTVVKTLRMTPAMAAGVTDHIWSLEEFMDAVLAEGPGEKPTPKPLAIPKPDGTARELPRWPRLPVRPAGWEGPSGDAHAQPSTDASRCACGARCGACPGRYGGASGECPRGACRRSDEPSARGGPSPA